jgi:hypothetical protein
VAGEDPKRGECANPSQSGQLAAGKQRIHAWSLPITSRGSRRARLGG